MTRFLETVLAGTLSTLLATLIVFIVSNGMPHVRISIAHGLGSYGESLDYFTPATGWYDTGRAYTPQPSRRSQ